MAKAAFQAPGHDVLEKRRLRNRNVFFCGLRVIEEDNVMASGTGHSSTRHDAELDELLDSQLFI